MYNIPPITLNNLKQRIGEAFLSAILRMLINAAEGFRKNLRLCSESDDRHFEHLVQNLTYLHPPFFIHNSN